MSVVDTTLRQQPDFCWFKHHPLPTSLVPRAYVRDELWTGGGGAAEVGVISPTVALTGSVSLLENTLFVPADRARSRGLNVFVRHYDGPWADRRFSRRLELVRVLLEHGADPNQRLMLFRQPGQGPLLEVTSLKDAIPTLQYYAGQTDFW